MKTFAKDLHGSQASSHTILLPSSVMVQVQIFLNETGGNHGSTFARLVNAHNLPQGTWPDGALRGGDEDPGHGPPHTLAVDDSPAPPSVPIGAEVRDTVQDEGSGDRDDGVGSPDPAADVELHRLLQNVSMKCIPCGHKGERLRGSCAVAKQR